MLGVISVFNFISSDWQTYSDFPWLFQVFPDLNEPWQKGRRERGGRVWWEVLPPGLPPPQRWLRPAESAGGGCCPRSPGADRPAAAGVPTHAPPHSTTTPYTTHVSTGAGASLGKQGTPSAHSLDTQRHHYHTIKLKLNRKNWMQN